MHTRRAFIKMSGGAIGGALGMRADGLITARGAPSLLAQDAPCGRTDSITITITASEFAFDAPKQVQAGLVNITMKNIGSALHMAQIGRLNDGVTFDQFATVLETKPQGSALPLFKFRGGPNNVRPGAVQEVMNILDAGNYVLICFVIDPDGVPHYMKGMLTQFEVVGNVGAGAEPPSDITVSMRDFAYEMPAQVTAGRHVWKVINDGPEPHEMEIMQLAPGVTQQQALSAFMAKTMPKKPGATPAATPSGPPPFVPAGGMGTLAPGVTGWMVTPLLSGEYLVLCQVPDPKTHKLHYMEGMVKAFTAAG